VPADVRHHRRDAVAVMQLTPTKEEYPAIRAAKRRAIDVALPSMIFVRELRKVDRRADSAEPSLRFISRRRLQPSQQLARARPMTRRRLLDHVAVSLYNVP
jgi:hypothetical protein